MAPKEWCVHASLAGLCALCVCLRVCVRVCACQCVVSCQSQRHVVVCVRACVTHNRPGSLCDHVCREPRTCGLLASPSHSLCVVPFVLSLLSIPRRVDLVVVRVLRPLLLSVLRSMVICS